MELEKSFLYTHLGHSVYSDIEKIDNAIDLIVESMIAYKDNELKKLRVTDVSIPDHIYIALEEFKCVKYGGLWEQMDKQVGFVDGQCATIDLIEEWLRSRSL
jgi:hypothetical protein